ncbi:MAG: LacI family DNA-binding transcriptional regulator [Candidatus Omnitrophota bacterium]
MASNKLTIKEVAKKAGVSIATVSRFLNNPTSLREENRKKVESIVKELNYRPLVYARRLAGGKLNSFGLIIPGYEGIFYSYYALETIRNIASMLDKDGIDTHLHIFWTKDNFKTSLVDGIIFADIIGNEGQLKRCMEEEIPLVVINRKVDDPGVSCVSIDNFKGGYEATDFLIKHGHKKVAHLVGDLRIQCAKERLDGYKAALQKNGISSDNRYIANTNFSRKIAREQTEKLMSLPDKPSAIFCCSDEVAVEVLAYCEEKKIKIPGGLSVVGFDDNPNCIHGNLMLTTIRQPLAKMASVGIQILKEKISKLLSNKKVVIEPELIVRDTVSFA